MFDDIGRKRDPQTIAFYCGAIPFGLAWALHQSLATGFALEVYLITCIVFVVSPFEFHPLDVKQRWFWKITLRAGAVVHSVTLLALWVLDVSYHRLVAGTGTIFLMAFVVSSAEVVILGEIVDGQRPPDSDNG